MTKYSIQSIRRERSGAFAMRAVDTLRLFRITIRSTDHAERVISSRRSTSSLHRACGEFTRHSSISTNRCMARLFGNSRQLHSRHHLRVGLFPTIDFSTTLLRN